MGLKFWFVQGFSSSILGWSSDSISPIFSNSKSVSACVGHLCCLFYSVVLRCSESSFACQVQKLQSHLIERDQTIAAPGPHCYGAVSVKLRPDVVVLFEVVAKAFRTYAYILSTTWASSNVCKQDWRIWRVLCLLSFSLMISYAWSLMHFSFYELWGIGFQSSF